MAPPRKLDSVGLAEAAEMVGVAPSTLSSRRRRRDLSLQIDNFLESALTPVPEPVAELRCGPIWRRKDIEAYATELQRLASMAWLERLDEYYDKPPKLDGPSRWHQVMATQRAAA